MTPKSISVSTRILALAAVLLIPVWGWAEITMTWTKKQVTDRTHIIVVPPGKDHLYLACDGRICATGATLGDAMQATACYRRMREAMQWMAPLNRSYNENKKIDPNFDFEGQYQEYPKNAAKWDLTVKDCVEDSK